MPDYICSHGACDSGKYVCKSIMGSIFLCQRLTFQKIELLLVKNMCVIILVDSGGEAGNNLMWMPPPVPSEITFHIIYHTCWSGQLSAMQ